MTTYHIIKKADLELELLTESKEYFNTKIGFEGNTHSELKKYLEDNSPKYGSGGIREKEGVKYWVLPNTYGLTEDRIEDEEVLCQSLSVDGLNNFGWDVVELELPA